MTILRKLLLYTIALLQLTACATQGSPSFAPNSCDVSWLEKGSVSPQKTCELRALAKRCAVSDRCYIDCEAKGGAAEIGGGCAHLCQGGGAQTDEDIAKNAGSYATAESIACYNSAR